MKDLMAAKPGIVPAGPLDGIQHAAHRVQKASGQKPQKTIGGQGLKDGHNGKDHQPAHKEVNGAGKPPGNGQLGDGEHHPGNGQGPNGNEQRYPPLSLRAVRHKGV